MDDSSRLSMVQKDSSLNSKPNGILKPPKELTTNKKKETLKSKSVKFSMHADPTLSYPTELGQGGQLGGQRAYENG